MDQEMVEILLLRFGNLGCQPSDAAGRRFYITSLAMDTAMTMFDFDSRGVQEDPISAMGKHRVLQLVDVWFSAHPLSPLVSKTLLVGNIKDETVDLALLATNLADACEIRGKTSPPEQRNNFPSVIQQGENDEVEVLLQFSVSQLRPRPLLLTNPATLSIAQTLVLIGWRELCLGHARRGTCYIGYTCQVVSRLYPLWRMRAEADGKKLNGVDIAHVEKEILQNIYWHCLSTTTWAFMQIDQPFSLLVPNEIPDFPSPDETTSAILHLDQSSDNISTLGAQFQAMRRFWPLSHITSTVAHIYTLYLNATAEDTQAQSAPWQKQHVHQLHRLLKARFDPSMLLVEIRSILLDAIKAVEREVTDITSQSCLVGTYHIIIIHMLFAQDQRGQRPLHVSQLVVQAFCQSVSAIVAIAQRFLPTTTAAVPAQKTPSNGGKALAKAPTLAFDSCSRGMLLIYEQLHSGPADEANAVVMMQERLADLAEIMYGLCKSDLVSQNSAAIRPVKKRFKQLKDGFRLLQPFTSPPLIRPPTNDGNDNTTNPPLSQNGESLHPSVDIAVDESLVSPSPIALSGLISCSPPSRTDSPNPGNLEPYLFVTDPELGSLLGFPGFTKTRDADPHSLGANLMSYPNGGEDVNQDPSFYLEFNDPPNPLLLGADLGANTATSC